MPDREFLVDFAMDAKELGQLIERQTVPDRDTGPGGKYVFKSFRTYTFIDWSTL